MAARLALALSLLTSVSLGGQASKADATLVTTSAVGEVRKPAESVTITVGVEIHDRSAAKAASGASQALQTVLTALEELGFDRAMLPTTGYSVEPDYDWDEEKVRGYGASTGVKITLDDVSALGKVIDTALGAGANDISSIDFHLRDSRAARDEALRLAFQAAKRDAEVLASASGTRLGRLAEVNTGRSVQAAFEETITVSAEARVARTHITAPEVVISARVETTWELETQ